MNGHGAANARQWTTHATPAFARFDAGLLWLPRIPRLRIAAGYAAISCRDMAVAVVVMSVSHVVMMSHPTKVAALVGQAALVK